MYTGMNKMCTIQEILFIYHMHVVLVYSSAENVKRHCVRIVYICGSSITTMYQMNVIDS